MAKFDKSVLAKYGITGTTEVLYNPSYEVLFNEETKEGLEGFEVGQETELGAVNVMTGIYTGRSPKDKFIVATMLHLTTLYGGILRSITTITTRQLQRHGTPLRRSLRRSFLIRSCS